jgi:hypothetical protein
VRFAVIRGWAALATAILAAVGSDVATEFAENRGWLGGVLRDNQHEGVLPALLLGVAVTLSLVLFVLFARIRSGDPLLARIGHFRNRLFDVPSSFFGSVLCVVAIEGYETRFGGLSPFDPSSVVLAHAVPLVVAFVVTVAIVRYLLHGAIRVANRASNLVVGILAEFLKNLRARTAPEMARASAFALRVVHVPPAVAYGSHGLRAPPTSIPSRYLIA